MNRLKVIKAGGKRSSLFQKRVIRNFEKALEPLPSIATATFTFTSPKLNTVFTLTSGHVFTVVLDHNKRSIIDFEAIEMAVPYLRGEAGVELEAKLYAQGGMNQALSVPEDSTDASNLLEGYHRQAEAWVGLFNDDPFDAFNQATDIVKAIRSLAIIVAAARRRNLRGFTD